MKHLKRVFLLFVLFFIFIYVVSIDNIPQQYVFTWDWLGKGYKFTVINHLYKSSKAKTKQGFKKLLAEALPLLIDPKNGLIKKPELSPADLNSFNRMLKQ